MKSRSVFEFGSYKTFMAYELSAKDRRGRLTRAAEALKCQRSYLSRVISETLHLTPDHAFQLAKFLRLPSDERDYFQLLVDFDRAGDPEYRVFLKQKIQEHKRKHESVQERAARSNLSVDTMHVHYFSSWIYSAIHFLVSVPEFQSVESIGNRLGLRPELVLRYLEQLRVQGFVEQKGGSRWVYRGGEFHAPKNSPLVLLHHQNWRARALQDAQDFENANVHFTAIQTVSNSDFERIKGLMLSFIEDASRIAGPSKPEEAIAITCDAFRI